MRKKRYSERMEKSPHEYKEMQCKAKRETKQTPYVKLYERLNTKKGENDLYPPVRKRDGARKDVQQVRVIEDRDVNLLTSEENVVRRWKEYFKQLMNE